MGRSFEDIMGIINQHELDYYRIYKSPTTRQRDKKFAFHALLALKKLKREIKNENVRNKDQGW